MKLSGERLGTRTEVVARIGGEIVTPCLASMHCVMLKQKGKFENHKLQRFFCHGKAVN